MKKIYSILILLIIIFISGCSYKSESLYQVSTIDALLTGVYDGDTSLKDLLKHGDTGIGTFNSLDGEMIIYNGRVYQVKSDGRVYMPDLKTKTPFAATCKFNDDINFIHKNDLNYLKLKELLDSKLDNKNIFYAFKISGEFKFIKTRSVPAQVKPYPPLKDVTANQPEFFRKNIKGALIGFRCPSFVKGINVPGYHLHFISSSKNFGGHVLEFSLNNADIRIDKVEKFYLNLPLDNSSFAGKDFSKDRSTDLKDVEE